ncbi:MAG: hypothetical protein MUF01_06400 [Bryobacterales bacterium]|jgi:hypothetical protein|nr:hypothetical protein [Bryobacterales bacterium]
MIEANESESAKAPSGADIRGLVHEAIQEFLRHKQQETEPAHRAELQEEKRRREQLESQVRELLQKTRESEMEVARARMTGAVRDELQKQGVTKVDLAFRVIKDDIRQTDHGDYVVRGRDGDVPLGDYVKKFVDENPEFLPPRIKGGSGSSGLGSDAAGARFDLDAIRPGMSEEERRQVHAAIANLASQTFKS